MIVRTSVALLVAISVAGCGSDESPTSDAPDTRTDVAGADTATTPDAGSVDGCTIEGKAVADGAVDPTDACRRCSVAASTSSWTSLADGSECAAGQVCQEGACTPGCFIDAAYYANGGVSPTSPCHVCDSAKTTSAWSDRPDDTPCGASLRCAGGLCTAGCVIGGQPFGAGAADPSDPCRSCAPSTTAAAFTTAPPGTECGFGRRCTADGCVAACQIDGVVVLDGGMNPADPCLICTAATLPTSWNFQVNGGSCGNGTCVANTCVAAPTVSDVTPSCAPNSEPTAVRVLGSGFAVGATVTFDDVEAAGTSVAGTDAIDTFAPVAPGKVGPVAVAVRNAFGASTVVTGQFTYYEPTGFAAPTVYQDGAGITDVFVGHVNGDQLLDVVVGRADATNGIGLYVGVGAGALSASGVVGTTGGVTRLVGADFNGDDKLDVAYTQINSAVGVILGNGDGTFQPATSVPVGTVFSHGIAAGTLDAGATLDFVVTDEDSPFIKVAKGNGDGTFSVGPPISVPAKLISAELADMNGDGLLDLAGAGANNGGIVVAMGDGNGGFGSVTAYSAGEGSTDVLIRDVNADGLLDLVAAHQSPAGTQVFFGQAGGTFSAAVLVFPLNTARVAVGDVNGDLKPDLVVNSLGQLFARAGQGDGSFPCGQPVVTSGESLYVDGADLDEDGKMDLLVFGDWSAKRLIVYRAE